MHAQTFIKFSIAIPPTGMFLGMWEEKKRGANFCTQPYLGNPSADQKCVHDNNALYVLLYITAYLDISHQKMPTTQLRIVTSC